AMIVSSLVFHAFWMAGKLMLLWQDPEVTPLRIVRDYLAGVRDRFFLNGELLGAFLVYLKPGFHPSQIDDHVLVEKVLPTIEKRYLAERDAPSFETHAATASPA